MNRFALFAVLVTVTAFIAAPTKAALTLTAAGSAGDHLFIGSPDVSFTSKWNTVPAGASANIYWDADKDGVFGETGIGENTGNAAGTLAFNAPIAVGGETLHFGMEGFGGAGSNGAIEFTIQRSDASTVRNLVHEGTPWVFNDSDGTEWTAAFEFNNGGYADVVTNIGSAPGGAASDHQGVLTLSRSLMFHADATNGSHTLVRADDGSPAWDNIANPASPNANWYVDDNGDRTFENSGNNTATQAYSTAITDGLTLEFVVEAFGFDGNDIFELAGFDIVDQSGATVIDGGLVVDGGSIQFIDSNWQVWLVEGEWTANGAGDDYVFNLGVGPTPGVDDHLFTLTFTAIPTPAALPAGLVLLGLAATRRKRRA